jgi:hypothetical protein
MGDALAVSLLNEKGFSPDDFARSHPSGALGRRLLTFVNNIMKTNDDTLRLVYPMFPFSLDYPFCIALRLSLTFMYAIMRKKMISFMIN